MPPSARRGRALRNSRAGQAPSNRSSSSCCSSHWGEEPGWRGFLLPRLQQRHGALRASLLLGAIWALWHLPLLGTEFAPQHIAPFLLTVFAATLVLTRLFNGAHGSVLLPMLMHATVNTVGSGFAFGFYAEADLTRLWWINAVLWSLAGAMAAWKMTRDSVR